MDQKKKKKKRTQLDKKKRTKSNEYNNGKKEGQKGGRGRAEQQWLVRRTQHLPVREREKGWVGVWFGSVWFGSNLFDWLSCKDTSSPSFFLILFFCVPNFPRHHFLFPNETKLEKWGLSKIVGA